VPCGAGRTSSEACASGHPSRSRPSWLDGAAERILTQKELNGYVATLRLPPGPKRDLNKSPLLARRLRPDRADVDAGSLPAPEARQRGPSITKAVLSLDRPCISGAHGLRKGAPKQPRCRPMPQRCHGEARPGAGVGARLATRAAGDI